MEEINATRVIYFDLETTGYRGCNKYSLKHQIIQFAALECTKDGEVFFCRYVKPDVPILQRSTDFHNITNEMVANAAPLGKVWGEFLSTYEIGKKADPIVLVAHNAHSFDRVVLLKELSRLGIGLHSHTNVMIGDSLLYFRHLAPADLRNKIEASTQARSKYNLSNLYKFYTQKEIPNAHDAGADVSALAYVCTQAQINWNTFPFLCPLAIDSVIWFFPLPNEDVDIIALHGIGPARKNALKRALRVPNLTIRAIRAKLGDEPGEIETFLRQKVKFDDDALILELVAYVSRVNPLRLLAMGFPFALGQWGRFNVQNTKLELLMMEKGIFTPQQLVEETLYDQDLKAKVLQIQGNKKAYASHSYRL